tara:strand:- start:1 stop:177 length:177 start_codon:yes stop_codon:yes gene_type:complete
MNAFSVAKQSTLLTNSVYHAYIYNGTIIANFFQGGEGLWFQRLEIPDIIGRLLSWPYL